MNCNIKKDAIIFKKDVDKTIHKNMSYNELLVNTIVLSEENIPSIPTNIRYLTIHSTIDMLLFELKMYYFLEISETSIFNANKNELQLIPITSALLSLYGVTQEQFLEDYSKQSLITF